MKVLKNILKPIFLLAGLLLQSLFIIALQPSMLYAQQTEKVELVQAGSLEGIETKAERKVKLVGNVIFKQGSMFLYCDSALQYPSTNKVETYGHVRMVQGDTLSLTCKTLAYDGNTKQAVASGNVVLKDNTMYLETERLNYDRNTKIAYYTNGGLIKDKENVLNSQQGSYHTDLKTVQFKKNVKLVNDVKQYKIDADTLEYNTFSKVATFKGPALLTSKDGVVEGHETGSYNTVSGVMYVKGRSKINNGKQVIEADKIDYDEVKQVGIAIGNAKLSSPKDSVQVEGDQLIYNRASGVSKVLGTPVFKGIQGKDTLFITSDTMVLIRIEDKKKTKVLEEYLKLYYHVKIFKAGMQGTCDSLIYNGNDSMITMFGHPVLWNGKSQLTADTIKLFIKNGQMHKMFMNVNAFIVMEDTIGNFNQVKGRKMEASFKNNKLKSVFVNGNSESIFFRSRRR